MQAGIISEENLAQILRSISQKRRHGVLEVHAGDKIVEISFYQGKIVDVVERRQSLARRVADRFERRGLISGGPWLATIESRQQLIDEAACQGEEISPVLMHLAQEQQALDDLYGLGLVEGSYYHFRVEMISAPTEDDLQLSVGQLLLDLVAIKEGRESFRARFPESLVLTSKARRDDYPAAEDRDIIGLADGKRTLAELRRHTLLGQLLFEETITHLVNCGALADGAAPAPAGLAFDLSALDASIDEYAADACRLLQASEVCQSPEGVLSALVARPALAVAGEIAPTPQVVSDVHVQAGVVRTSVVSGINQRLLENVHTPELVLALFAALALFVPLIVW